MNMPLNNPANPMQPPEQMAGPGIQDGLMGPGPGLGYEAVPLEPAFPTAGGPQDLLEIQDAIEAVGGESDALVEQAWNAPLMQEAVAEPLAFQGVVEPVGQELDPNPYGAPQEHWEFPDEATGVGPVTAVTSPRETVIQVPGQDLTIRRIEPHGDKIILDPDLRRKFTPQVPDRLLSSEELCAKYGRHFTGQEIGMLRQADACGWNTPGPEVPDRLLPDKLLLRKYGPGLTDKELARIREADGRAAAGGILKLLGQTLSFLTGPRRP